MPAATVNLAVTVLRVEPRCNGAIDCGCCNVATVTVRANRVRGAAHLDNRYLLDSHNLSSFAI